MNATTDTKPLEMNVELWRYVMELATKDPAKLTQSERVNLAFFSAELGLGL